MTDNITNITNTAIGRSVPAFIQDQYPQFVAFCEAYFDFLSIQGNPNDVIQNFLNYTDIDATLDDFIIHFQNKYAPLIPNDIRADKRLVIKHIKKFYKGKGSESGFRFLFRILFNEDIEFYYPGTDVLKASDGKWQQNISLKIPQADVSSLSSLFNVKLSGALSFSKAIVYAVLSYNDRGVPVYELILNDLRGKFVDGEEILLNGQSNSPKIFILEVVAGVNIIDGGSRYNVGDQVNIIDTNTTLVVGTGNVSATSRGPISGFDIISGGSGYNGEFKEVTDFAYLPIGWTLDGVYLPDAVIGGDSHNEDFSSETISHLIDLQDVPGTGDLIHVTDEPSPVGNGASGIVHLVSQNGEILETRVINVGENYDQPVSQVISTTGSGAILQVDGGGGRITAVQLNNFPVVLRSEDFPNDSLVPDFSPSPTGSEATGSIVLGGGTITYAGTWINDDGKLSSTKKLQDNKFYQDFSYVLLSRLNSAHWQNIVDKISHPAGFINFGELKFKSMKSMPLPIVAETTLTLTFKDFLVTPDGFQIGFPDGGDLISK